MGEVRHYLVFSHLNKANVVVVSGSLVIWLGTVVHMEIGSKGPDTQKCPDVQAWDVNGEVRH